MDSSDLERGSSTTTEDDYVPRTLRELRRNTWGSDYTDKKAGSISQSVREYAERPMNMIRKFKLPSIRIGSTTTLSSGISTGRQGFLTKLCENDEETVALQLASNWCLKYLDHKFNTFWSPMFQRSLAEIDHSNLSPSPGDLDILYSLVTKVAEQVAAIRNVSLVRIVDKLLNDRAFREPEDETNKTYIVVFTVLGWITMLFEPYGALKVVSSDKEELRISATVRSIKGIETQSESSIFDYHSQDFDLYDHPLTTLLDYFGGLIPEPPPPVRGPNSAPYQLQYIYSNLVCYHTLKKVCGIEILFTDAIAEHLEFNSSLRVLKIFRFPSFCRLMYKHKKRSFLSQLFDDHACTLELPVTEKDEASTSKFFAELLLTYRLLFGQDAKSYKLFTKELTRVTKKGKEQSIMSLPDADPFLLELCGNSCESSPACELYKDIRAEKVETYYQSASFRNFAMRIHELQNFVRGENPHNLSTLWHDRRNEGNWWQFWAVLIIGGGTLLLGTMQLVFQVWQAVSSQESLK